MTALGHRCRGFTLAELLISLALMALLMAAVATAIHAAHQSYVYNAEKTDMVARVRGVLDRLARDLRRAGSVDVADDTRTITVSLDDGTTHTYAWDGETGGDLTLTVDSGTPVTLTGYVTAFYVAHVEPSYEIRLVLEGGVAGTEGTISATPRKVFF